MNASRGPVSGARRRHLRWLGSFVAVLFALTWVGGTANATIIERDKYSQPYDVVNWDCGYPMRVVGVENHSVHIRQDKKIDGNVFVTDNYDFNETWTATDGRHFGMSANAIAKDVKGHLVKGSVYKFTYNIAGQPETITDASGRVFSKDRGLLSFTYTIDISDGTFNFLGAKVAGPHPSFDIDTCKIVAPLVGTNSARYLTPRPKNSTGFGMGFYEYLPPSYSPSGPRSPLLIALNGYGESGDGTPDQLSRLLGTGIPRFIDVGGWPTNRPLVVLALQHHEEPGFDWSSCQDVPWGGSCGMQVQHDNNNKQPAFCTTPYEVHDFITFAVNHYHVDPAKVYVTGLSCGAYGLWEYLSLYGNQQVAAAVPIAGYGLPAWHTAHCDLASVPIWAFHGALDDVVDPAGSIDTMHHIQDCDGGPSNHARLTVYPDLYHDGWNQAYSGSEGQDIYAWMLGFHN